MNRSGYSDDYDPWQLIMWRGAVASAINGKRGQAFLQEMLAALDAMPEKKLIAEALEDSGAVCAMGAVGVKRGLNMGGIDPYDRETVAATFNIAPALAAEIAWENDENGNYWKNEAPEDRWTRVRKWVVANIKAPP